MNDVRSTATKGPATAPKPRRAVFYTWAAAIAAMVGFAAVYVTYGLSDNGAGAKNGAGRAQTASQGGSGSAVAQATSDASNSADASAAPAKRAAKAAPPTQTGAQLRKSLRTGHMVTFVFKKKRLATPPLQFTDGTGKTISMDQWRGKVVLLNLWATWCAPCRREMPDLDKLQGALGSKDFEVVAISVDRKGLKASKRFLDQIKIKNLALYNDASARISRQLKVLGMPTTLLLDREGKEIGRLVGPAEWNSEDARRLIKAHF